MVRISCISYRAFRVDLLSVPSRVSFWCTILASVDNIPARCCDQEARRAKRRETAVMLVCVLGSSTVSGYCSEERRLSVLHVS